MKFAQRVSVSVVAQESVGRKPKGRAGVRHSVPPRIEDWQIATAMMAVVGSQRKGKKSGQSDRNQDWLVSGEAGNPTINMRFGDLTFMRDYVVVDAPITSSFVEV